MSGAVRGRELITPSYSCLQKPKGSCCQWLKKRLQTAILIVSAKKVWGQKGGRGYSARRITEEEYGLRRSSIYPYVPGYHRQRHQQWRGEVGDPVWEDGTPAYTIKKFGVVNRYDLSKEFPARLCAGRRSRAVRTSFCGTAEKIQQYPRSHFLIDENGSIGRRG